MFFRRLRAARLVRQAASLFRSKADAAIDDIRPAFDPAFYCQQNPDVAEAGLDPVLHYFRLGWKEGRDPSPQFSTRYYLENNADVAKAGLNPFWHYLVAGRLEKRRSRSALGAPDPSEMAVMDDIRAAFDALFYLQRYADVRDSGADPVSHYCLYGWREERDPAPDFSTSYYLAANPDVAAAGLNPFWHFIASGRQEGRSGLPLPPDAVVEAGHDHATIAAHFDAAFYLSQNPDLAQGKVSAVDHYCNIGWKEGRDPAPFFSTRYYLESNPDVVAAGINPFWHYLVAGRNEGRAPSHPGGYKAAILQSLLPLEDMVANWRRPPPESAPLTANSLERMILEACHGERSRLILSISHDDYTAVSGGVQSCIQREERLSPAHGATYLNLHPVQPLPRLAHLDRDDEASVHLVLDGRSIGHAPISTVIAAMQTVAPRLSAVQCVIHHLMGHAPERIVDLIKATGADSCCLWLHDFFTLCPSYTLQRNGITFCGAPAPGSNACRLCVYGAERISHQARVRDLFAALRIHALAPSSFMAAEWTARSGLAVDRLTVLPLLTLHWPETQRRPPNRPIPQTAITLAFIGYPAAQKGWPIFQALASAARLPDTDLRFLYFGATPVTDTAIGSVAVHVSEDDPDAMIRAISEHQVDLVLHWANSPETFSFTTHEALAGGAWVLTNPGSGNVAVTVRETGEGVVLQDEDDLRAFFTDGRLAQVTASRRAASRHGRPVVIRSAMVHTILSKDGAS